MRAARPIKFLAAALIVAVFAAAAWKLVEDRRTIARLHARIAALEDNLPGAIPAPSAVDLADRLPERPPDSRIMGRGKILAASPLPANLEKAPYADALRTVAVELARSYRGTPAGGRMVVLQPVLGSRKLLPAAAYRVGDAVAVDAIPFALGSSRFQQMQRIDGLNYPFGTELWLDSGPGSRRPGPDEVVEARTFLGDRDRIFARYRESFLDPLRPWKRPWVLEENTLAYLRAVDLFEKLDGQETPAAAILDFASHLQSRGVRFIFVSLPTKAEVHPRRFCKVDFPAGFRRFMAPQRVELIHELTLAGIEAVDAAPVLRAAADAGELPLFRGADPHLSHRGAEIVGALIAGKLARIPVRSRVTLRGRKIDYTPPPELGDYGGEPLPFKITQVADQAGALYEPDEQSRLVLAGDSNLYYWQTTHGPSAGIGAHVALARGERCREISSGGMQPHHLRRWLPQLQKAACVVYIQSAWILRDARLPWVLSGKHVALDPGG